MNAQSVGRDKIKAVVKKIVQCAGYVKLKKDQISILWVLKDILTS